MGSSDANARVDSARGKRLDIQLLRAFAVAAVVLYHLWPSAVPGGYIGVDVFFVISGFLIISHIFRDLGDGSFSLPSFWARRARRLLPASLTVIAASAIATVIWAPLSVWQQYFGEMRAATLYIENLHLAFGSVDYLASELGASPVRHFWSLSAEEQFYIAVPILLAAVAAVASWRGVSSKAARRRLVIGVLATLTVASAVYSVWMTANDPAMAYFHTAVRVWEFAVGGLVAFLPAVRGTVGRWSLGAIGAAAMLASAMLYSDSTPFPGLAAALPVLGAAAVIVAWVPITRSAALRPVEWLGDASYSIYLWHWPLIVLLPYVVGRPMDDALKIVALGLSLVLAAMSLRWIETPVLRWRPRMPEVATRVTFASTAAAMIIAVAATTLVQTTARDRVEANLEAARAFDVMSSECFGAEALVDGCAPSHKGLIPDPSVAFDDVALADSSEGGCTPLERSESEARICALGDRQGTFRLVVIGDSHAIQWLDVLDSLSNEQGWALDAYTKNGCQFSTVQKDGTAGAAECLTWTANVTAELISDRPDAVLVTSNHGLDYVPIEGETNAETGVRGLVEAWTPVIEAGVPIVALRDNPHSPAAVAECLDFHPDSADVDCVKSRERALGEDLQPDAILQLGSPLVTLLDLTDFYCAPEQCSAVVGGAVVYRDSNHITQTYLRSVAEAAKPAIIAALTAQR